MATAVAGHVLGINPFDQPNVQEAKDATKAILASAEAGSTSANAGPRRVRRPRRAPEGGDRATTWRSSPTWTEPPKPRTRSNASASRSATAQGGDHDRVRPAFLHSTGQLHKGGANNGVFIQVVDAERSVDLPIPGQPYTFGTLIHAQALGDLRSLRARGRRVARVTFDRLMEVL